VEGSVVDHMPLCASCAHTSRLLLPVTCVPQKAVTATALQAPPRLRGTTVSGLRKLRHMGVLAGARVLFLIIASIAYRGKMLTQLCRPGARLVSGLRGRAVAALVHNKVALLSCA
jgi:hypothetical protein